jgi:hypothetical protein
MGKSSIVLRLAWLNQPLLDYVHFYLAPAAAFFKPRVSINHTSSIP